MPARRSEEVSPGIIVDYDDQDRVAGVEMLYLSKRAPNTEVHRLLFESVPKQSDEEIGDENNPHNLEGRLRTTHRTITFEIIDDSLGEFLNQNRLRRDRWTLLPVISNVSCEITTVSHKIRRNFISVTAFRI